MAIFWPEQNNSAQGGGYGNWGIPLPPGIQQRSPNPFQQQQQFPGAPVIYPPRKNGAIFGMK